MLSLFLFLLLIYGVSDSGTDESESVSVTEGDSVTLHTNLTEVLNDDTILWLFGPKHSLISQIRRKDDLTAVVFTDDERFRGRLQVDQKTGSLTIRNTRIKHSGQYKLSISRQKTTTVIFNVTVSGVLVETDGVKSLSVTEGESVTLHADAEMHKDALMLWRFGDKGLLLAKIDVDTNETSLNDDDERFRDRLKLDQTGSLTITNTRTTDSGLYELQIRGTESSQQFLLSVSAIPDPQLSTGAKAGVGFGVIVPVLLLVAAAFALIYYIRRNSKLKKQMGQENNLSVMEGDSQTLHTGLTEIQGNDTIEWCYEAETNLIAEINGGTRKPSTLAGADGRFRSKLMLDENNGDLTISNIRTIHSGLYILKISNSSSSRHGCSSQSIKKTKYKRFIVTVSVRTVQVKEGDAVPLMIDTGIQRGDLILWTFGPENSLVVKADPGPASISPSFRHRVQLDETTGSLTVTNIRTTDSGHFKLQIINSKQTTFRRFNVSVTGNRENESATEEMQLLNRVDLDGGNEEQATSSV